MGSSQSHPSRPSTSPPSSSSSTSPRPARPPLRPPSSASSSSNPLSTSRFSSLRRLSAMTRRDSSKRNRAGSSVSADGEQKKRRVEGSSPPPTNEHITSPTPPSGPLSPVTPTLAPPISSPGITSPPPGSPDLLLPDRLRTLSTISDTLGPDWASTTPNGPTAQERLSRLRRQSLPLESPNRLSERLYSFLGISASSPATTPPTLGTASEVDEFARRLDEARTSLANTRTELDEARRRLQELERVEATASTGGVAIPAPESSAGSHAAAHIGTSEPAPNPNGAARTPVGRIPTGAVLVIQGLAQTTRVPGPDQQQDAQSGPPSRPTPVRQRSASDSALSSPLNGESELDRLSRDDTAVTTQNGNDDPLESQARMISGLLTVAASATATTLLAPNHNTQETRPSGNAISNFLDRIRPNRRNPPTVESALGDYLRNALRNRRAAEQGSSTMMGVIVPDAAPAVDTSAISDDFQRFLEGMQGDIVGAVREFATPPASGQPNAPDSEANAAGPASNDVDASPTPVPTGAANEPVAASHGEATNEAAIASEQGASPASSEIGAPIPTFHHQAGQIRADDPARRYGVSGGEDGTPRRLNFFRAHRFPPVQDGDPEQQAGTDDPNGMVPCIFVGVRSLAHDPTMTTDELVGHPGFPFTNGNVPADATDASTSAPSDSSTSSSETITSTSASVPSPPTLTRTISDRPATPMPGSLAGNERRSIRERLLNRFQPRPPPRPVGPMNTYLVFVVGGYYPRSHPVLSIPNLMSGGPLTDEEMALVSELLGPGKPPTASKEDIENSGLEVIPASDIAKLGAEGKVLENCVERCLVCLGDYEEEEECRVLKCRHAFHKDCVDHWLSSGRNSCPACRSEAVEVKKIGDGSAAAPTAADSTAGPSVVTAEGSDPRLDQLD